MTSRQERRQATERLRAKVDSIADTLDDPPEPEPVNQAEVERVALAHAREALETTYRTGAVEFDRLAREEGLAVAG